MTKKDGGDNFFHIKLICDHQVFDISDQFESEFHSKPNIVFLASFNEETEFILQHGHFIDHYTLCYEAPEEEEKEEEIADAEDQEQAEKKSEASDKAKKPVVKLLNSFDASVRDEHGKHPKNLIHNAISEGLNFRQHEKQGHHTSHHKDYLILNDHVNIYKIDQTSRAVTVYESKPI